MTQFNLTPLKFSAFQSNFSFADLPKFSKPEIFKTPSRSLPQFQRDAFRQYRFFKPEQHMQDGSADLQNFITHDNSSHDSIEKLNTDSNLSKKISSETMQTLTQIGLSEDEINSLINGETPYYDNIAKAGSYKGYLANVRYVGNNAPSAQDMTNRITRGGSFHLHTEYDHFGLAFKTTFNGDDYLFIQFDSDIDFIPTNAKSCYMLKLTNNELPDGGSIHKRELVTNESLRKLVMQNAVNNGDLQRALNSANAEKLIEGYKTAHQYADAALSGGLTYGFSGTLTGYMAETSIVNIVTPEGFCIQFEKYVYHVPGRGRVNGLSKILNDTKSYRNHLNATKYLATGN